MHKILKYKNNIFLQLVNKIIASFVILAIINILIFTILNALNPVPYNLQVILNQPDQNQQLRADIIEKYQLHSSLGLRVLDYIGRFFRLDFKPFSSINPTLGVASKEDTFVVHYFLTNNLTSYKIGLISFVFSFVFGYLLGVFAAYKHGTWVDYIINWFVIIFVSISLLILIPIINMIVSSTGTIIDFDVNKPSTYVLPIICLVLIGMSPVTQITRNEIIKVLNTEYYTVGRTLGHTRFKIFASIVFKNSISPVLTLLPLIIISLFISSIFLEQYYSVPGNWKFLYSVIQNNENEPICFLIAFLSFVYLVGFIISETTKTLINPIKREAI